jgi:predicted permease
MQTLIEDLRYSLRLFRRSPGFALVAIIALALGIGANTAIFSVVDGVLLQPLPYPDSSRLVMAYEKTQDFSKSSLAYPNLRVMSIPLRKGRFFSKRDTTASASVVVIDDVMAKNMFPGQDPVGKQINMQVIGAAQIVGVVGHVKFWGLGSDDTAKIRNEMYFPFAQIPDKYMPEIMVGANLLIRTAPDPLSTVSAVRAQVAGPTNDQPMYSVQTMDQIISMSLAERRFTMLMLIIFAATALALASVGIYGVMSYSVTRRTHELGVRMALGATRSNVLRLVVREGMVLAVVGLAVGLMAALGLARLMASLLYGVRPADPLTLLAVSLSLATVAFLASYVPARRATKVDPMIALRYE